MDFSTCITGLLKKSFSKCFLKWSFITIGNTGYLTFLKSNSDCILGSLYAVMFHVLFPMIVK